MIRGDIISYIDMTLEEGLSLQRGMNFHIPTKDYGIILMSVRQNAPYADRIENSGTTIIYEGHDIRSNLVPFGKKPKEIDQPMYLPSGSLTENGKFFEAAQQFKKGAQPKIVKVYEKISQGVWSYNGKFCLVDAWIEQSNNRKVFKFCLEAFGEESDQPKEDALSKLELEHNRLIPTAVKVEVWKRDHGQCVHCGACKNLHYDHIIPFSKGGSSITSSNIQLLCAKCNLSKHDKIE